ncbi:predicted protein [Histoplasma capsulatum H143]|uniref:Uncharacterized protein n=1 Tax=Ajellomyces capsulatus (strain H143) TaxID=544712 RepID=C6HGR1_AJECH|nr:predicted protein [Histoplasma capsulatum H143]
MLPAPIGNGLPRIWIMATSLTLFNPRPLLLLQNLFKIVPKISELFTTSRQTSLQKLLSFTAGRRILEALSYLSHSLQHRIVLELEHIPGLRLRIVEEQG